jgi:hypothetical protein
MIQVGCSEFVGVFFALNSGCLLESGAAALEVAKASNFQSLGIVSFRLIVGGYSRNNNLAHFE